MLILLNFCRSLWSSFKQSRFVFWRYRLQILSQRSVVLKVYCTIWLFLQQNAGIQGGKRISTTGHSDPWHSCVDVAPLTLKLCFWMVLSINAACHRASLDAVAKIKILALRQRARRLRYFELWPTRKTTVLPILPALGTVLDLVFKNLSSIFSSWFVTNQSMFFPALRQASSNI